MALAVSQWAVGFLLTLIVIRVFTIKAEGIFAMLMITAVPYGLGRFLFELLKINF